MKRDKSIFNYGHAVWQQDIIENSVLVMPEVKDIQDSHDPAESFLQIVYALDCHQVPTGDLTYLVSDKANPEVKKWILDNLMQDVSSQANLAVPVNSGLSDDDIAALARDPREDTVSYMNRINQYANQNKALYERLSKAAVESVAEKQPVSSESGSASVSDEQYL